MNLQFPDVAPSFPIELKQLKRWVVRTADKHPHSAYEEDEKLGTIDPHEEKYQSEYDNALGALDQTTKYSGLGFVFNYADGITGVDFDDCVDPTTLEIRPDILEIIRRADSYTEFSPSRSGIHIFTKGWQFPIDPSQVNDEKRREGSKIGDAEIYSGKRYFTVTGHHVPGTPLTVNDRDLGWLYERIVVKREFAKAKPAVSGGGASSSCVVTSKNPSIVGSKYNTLMFGGILRSKDTTGSSDFAIEDDAQIIEYESQSSADYALLGLIADKLSTNDAEEIKAEFMKSPLGARPKASRDGYLDASIQKLLKEPRVLANGVDESGEKTGVSVDRPKLLTEVGNARRLIEAYGKNIRYCSEDGQWLFFGGKVWQLDRHKVHLHDLVKRILMGMQAEASQLMNIVDSDLLGKVNKNLTPKKILAPDDKGKMKRVDITLSEEEYNALNQYEAAKAFYEWSVASESNQKINGTVEQAKSEPGISIAKSALDANKLVCNVENGSFVFAPESASYFFGKHKREDLCTKMMPVQYIPNADCPQFKKFFEWMFPQKEVRDFLQTYFGLCLTGIVVRKALILYGEGANGKSTLMRTLQHLFGEVLDKDSNLVAQAYSEPVAFTTFSVGRDESAGGARADLLPLKGMRLVTASESNKSGKKNGVKLDMARIKEMTGGEKTVARGLYQPDPTKFLSQAKIVLQTNNLPQIDDDSDGAWERLKLVKCAAKVDEKDQDEQLPEKLIQERSGILNWLLEGIRMYFEKGFVEPACITLDTEAFRGAESHISRFVQEECEITDSETVKTISSHVYHRYKTWCSNNGEEPETQKGLTAYLQRRLKVFTKPMRDGNFLCKLRLKPQEADINLGSGSGSRFVVSQEPAF